ncbi:GFA family protein [Novilysobacter avium]|uniref:CENP-V/GFA domain-containing protein n=1 Tax=Novilysobacter avium TaxID=2781023 RepID=A0A7S6ZUI8_9GAMM|nr:DUF6151 family protein [Lysobacter avium]QOW22173.1 hypothetical protein INQ42_00645 [Lysobacter avium]
MTDAFVELTCRCGKVQLEVNGNPIISVECLCADCRKAGAVLQALPDAPRVLDANAATRFVLYRKDRVRCTQGQSWLREHRLSSTSKTRRVVATCCNTPVFLEFTNGHWLSLYGGLWDPATLPTLETRTMTRDRPPGVELPDDVPNPRTHAWSFVARLLRAWVAMGFRAPKVDFVTGALDAPSAR